jgi:hypothetical protein
MIQFNLLPDVKMEYMKARRTKRLVVAVSIATTATSLVIMAALLMVVLVFQRQYMRDLNKDITEYSKNLQATTDIDKILTVQNQLTSLPALHQDKPDTTRLFTYLKRVTPSAASIASVVVDFEENTMNITGSANSLVTVNEFVDTLKFTDYDYEHKSERAFSEVVLATFGRADKGASYTLTLKFDPAIFDNTKKVELFVPIQVTTRSETEKPAALFEAVTNSKKE